MQPKDEPEERNEDLQKEQLPAEQQQGRAMTEAQQEAAEEREEAGGYQ